MTDDDDKPPKEAITYKVWLDIERYDELDDTSQDLAAPGGALASAVSGVHAEPLKPTEVPDDWELPFPITSVCRNDVLVRFSGEEVERLTDADMQRLARKMEDAYVQQQYWDDLEWSTDEILSEKELTDDEESK